MQESVSELLARIQCVERDGDDVYVMGDDVSVHTENITALTRPPSHIRDKHSLSLLFFYKNFAIMQGYTYS